MESTSQSAGPATLRAGLEQYAAQEKRTLGNVGELILEWGFQQLLAAGSTERLLKCSIGSGLANPNGANTPHPRPLFPRV